jgi:hypothetical protein
MTDLGERLSKVEAVQHFQTAMIGALAKACQSLPQFSAYARENLQMHHAILLGESRDEVKVKAFEELMEAVLGPQK